MHSVGMPSIFFTFMLFFADSSRIGIEAEDLKGPTDKIEWERSKGSPSFRVQPQTMDTTSNEIQYSSTTRALEDILGNSSEFEDVMDDINEWIGNETTYLDSQYHSWRNKLKGWFDGMAAAKYAAATEKELTWDDYLAINIPALEPVLFSEVNAWFQSQKPADEWAGTTTDSQDSNPSHDLGIKSFAYHMLSAMLKISLEKHEFTYRYQLELDEDWEQGQIFTPGGFYFATLHQQRPKTRPYPVKIIIHHGLSSEIGKCSVAYQEEEVVFAPGSSFEIREIKRDQLGPYHTIVEMVYQPDGKPTRTR